MEVVGEGFAEKVTLSGALRNVRRWSAYCGTKVRSPPTQWVKDLASASGDLIPGPGTPSAMWQAKKKKKKKARRHHLRIFGARVGQVKGTTTEAGGRRCSFQEQQGMGRGWQCG